MWITVQIFAYLRHYTYSHLVQIPTCRRLITIRQKMSVSNLIFIAEPAGRGGGGGGYVGVRRAFLHPSSSVPLFQPLPSPPPRQHCHFHSLSAVAAEKTNGAKALPRPLPGDKVLIFLSIPRRAMASEFIIAGVAGQEVRRRTAGGGVDPGQWPTLGRPRVPSHAPLRRG